MSEQRARTFHVVTVVWGQSFVELFLDVAVPNQLTPGNLGALPAGSRYRVFTSPEDVETLAASAILGRVNEVIPLDLVMMPELSQSAVNAMDRMTACHCRALADAREAEAALVFLNADHFMSEGALAAVVRRHAAGSRAVASTGVRLNRGAFVSSLQARASIRSLSSRELVSLALDNLHPFTLAHTIDGARTARWPISLYWNVPGEGILARSFYLHPLMVDPVCRDVLPRQGFTIDAKYLVWACPEREQIHVVSDSDELCLFELSHVEAAVAETAPGGISPWRAATLLSHCDLLQKSYWAQPIRLHSGDIGAVWNRVETQSAHFANQAARLLVVARWLRVTSGRLKRLRQRAGAFRKRLRRVAKREGRQALRRARRSLEILTHSLGRPVLKVRKRAARAGRRALRRARTAH